MKKISFYIILFILSVNAFAQEVDESYFAPKKKGAYNSSSYAGNIYNKSNSNGNRLTNQQANTKNSFFSYNFSTIAPVGISVGSLKPKGLGYYTALRTNLFLPISIYEVDQYGYFSDDFWIFLPTGNVKMTTIEWTMGFTGKLVGSVYAFTGFGYYSYKYYEEFEQYGPYTGDYIEDEWIRVVPNDLTGLAFEAGLMFKLNTTILTLGASYFAETSFLDISAGLGFVF